MQTAKNKVIPLTEQWQQMESAPKDGSTIIGWTDTGHFVRRLAWSDGSWVNDKGIELGFTLIAWMPMPEPPSWWCDK